MKATVNNNVFTKSTPQSDEEQLKYKVRLDRIGLLYQQIPIGIIGQFLVSVTDTMFLWPITPHSQVMLWGLYMLIIPSIWMSFSIYYRYRPDKFQPMTWLVIFTACAFLSACGWGFVNSVLLPTDHLLNQSMMIIILVGMTAGANPFFCAFIPIYALFLFPSFIPFNIFLFFQGGYYALLGICGIVYLTVIFGSCVHSNRFIVSSLTLRYKNLDLDSLNQFLERRVQERTSDLEKSLAITRSTLESTADGILVVQLDGTVDYSNQKFLDMWGLPSDFISLKDSTQYLQQAMQNLNNHEEFLNRLNELNENTEIESYDELYFTDGKVFECYSKPYQIRHSIVGRVWSFRDITMRKQMEYQLSYQANHDLLTGLPNRTLLYDRIKQGINYANRYKNFLNMLFLDIDNFKLINDNLGHEAGDVLLKEVARRLKECIRETDTVARFGGDEFIILFITREVNEAKDFSQKVLEKVSQPIQLITHEIVVTTSIGVSMYPKDGEDAATLLKNADVAMYLAKNHGRNNFKLYDDANNELYKNLLEMQIQIRNGIDKNEFFLLYQPIYNMKTYEIVSVEVLVRWLHPDKGLLNPREFIPIAEESGLIVNLGSWILKQACLQNKLWQDQGFKPLKIAINISGVQLQRDNFIQIVEDSLKESGLSAQFLEIELTESTIMSDNDTIVHSLKHFDAMGIHLTIDDFGTGYSSLNYLKQFPVSKLKIDQSFVENCTVESNDASIIEAIIAMGHGLKLKVLAEGIELFGKPRV